MDGIADPIQKLIADAKAEAMSYAVQVVDAYNQLVEQRNELYDKQLEVLQNQVGALTQGYLEATALIQALMSQLMNDSPEKVEEFKKHIIEARQTYMDNLRYATRMAAEASDHFTAINPDDDTIEPGTPDTNASGDAGNDQGSQEPQ